MAEIYPGHYKLLVTLTCDTCSQSAVAQTVAPNEVSQTTTLRELLADLRDDGWSYESARWRGVRHLCPTCFEAILRERWEKRQVSRAVTA